MCLVSNPTSEHNINAQPIDIQAYLIAKSCLQLDTTNDN